MNTSITDTMPWGKFGGKCSIMRLPQWYIDWFLSTVKQEQHRSLYGAVNYVNDTRKARNKQRGEKMAEHNVVWDLPKSIKITGRMIDHRTKPEEGMLGGKLTVLYPYLIESTDTNYRTWWLVKCTCGAHMGVKSTTLVKGAIKDCSFCGSLSGKLRLRGIPHHYADEGTRDLVEEQDEKGKLSKTQPSASADMDVSVPEPATCRVDIDEIIQAQEWVEQVKRPSFVLKYDDNKGTPEEVSAMLRDKQDFVRYKNITHLQDWLDGLCS